ncbi:hypothetical protein CMK12_15815 [Candidatus Poribacteria bacterium]|nr:hypothetical protein [Candidatus Poribacteria bacterium]
MAILREALLTREKRLKTLVAECGQGESMYMEGPALVWDLQHPIQEKLLIVPYMLSFPGIIMKRWHADERKWKALEQDAGLPLLTWAQTCPILAEVVRFLPEDVTSVASSVRYLQVSVLNHCMTNPAFKQLCESDFNLAWLFLGCADQAQLRTSDIEHWLTRPRVDLLELVTGHREKWVLKWLRKVRASVGDVHEWKRLQRWASEPQQVAYLAGFGVSSVGFLQSVILIEPSVDIRNWHLDLEELKAMPAKARNRWLYDVKKLGEDVQRLGKALGVHPAMHFKGVCSYKGLQRRHDKWAKRLNDSFHLGQSVSGAFPRPPLEGNDVIQPIRTFYHLCCEGQEMQHCVSSYSEKVMRGESYIYRYLGAQRATIELICQYSVWSIGQIKGHNNDGATEQTIQAVKHWFDQYEYSTQSFIDRRRSLVSRPNDVFFPVPPFVTTSPLSALETEQMFANEQRYMNGHIQSTVAQIHAGERYVYRIDDPDAERVVEFEKSAEGRWQMINMVRRDGSYRKGDDDLLDWWLAMNEPPYDWSVFEKE